MAQADLTPSPSTDISNARLNTHREQDMPLKFSESPNARSKSITTTDFETHGVLNRHAAQNLAFQVGVSEDKGSRRTMEDSHSFVVDYDNVRGQGFFAVFDGHAGKHAAEWCGTVFHQYLLQHLHASPKLGIPDILNQTFHAVDESLSQLCQESDGKIHSGCTAVTAFLRIEDSDGHQSFLSLASSPSDSPVSAQSTELLETPPDSGAESGNGSGEDSLKKQTKKTSSRSRLKNAIMSLGSGSLSGNRTPKSSGSLSPAISRKSSTELTNNAVVRVPPPDTRRVLYTANVGDARGVLCRAGKAIRLTYDHKGSDKQEAKRITDAGGFVLSGRVNGILAVTRSLGDSSMKDFVVGAPYTTETELCDEDEYLILACDGLWDVASDQAAVELIRGMDDPQQASSKLMKYALSHHTTDNVTVVVVRLKDVVPRTA